MWTATTIIMCTREKPSVATLLAESHRTLPSSFRDECDLQTPPKGQKQFSLREWTSDKSRTREMKTGLEETRGH